jgi:hypothetical protein
VQDVIVLAWGYLSCLLWQLGYTQQAEAAGRQSVQKAREIGQPSRLAFALHSEMQAAYNASLCRVLSIGSTRQNRPFNASNGGSCRGNQPGTGGPSGGLRGFCSL